MLGGVGRCWEGVGRRWEGLPFFANQVEDNENMLERLTQKLCRFRSFCGRKAGRCTASLCVNKNKMFKIVSKKNSCFFQKFSYSVFSFGG